LAIFRRIPNIQQILPVYGLIVVLVYGWTIYWFVWNLPSWLGLMPLMDVFSILAYSFIVNFLESIVVLGVLIVVGIILPENWLRGDFVVVGGFVVLYFLIFSMFLLYNFVYLPQLGKLVAAAFLLFIIVQYVIKRLHLTRVAIGILADRSIIFLYMSIPATVAGLIVVLARNL
jgi:hypothetical protein